ncbi:phosphoserine phosphatase SerB [Saxibacter everestensis]|uniref:phosphoserine phosphatase n=1 Tax=Saxibacter everestensis TaxID=2909229 RepID=A0ABY8QXM8_9MICO|nr:phosphoserine phosphatase SerB [Brevibacteriaceae bacterium ZFBP1038]
MIDSYSHLVVVAETLNDDQLKPVRDILGADFVESRTSSTACQAVHFRLRIEATADQQQAISRAATRLGLDTCWLPAALQRSAPGLLVLDVDSTFIDQEVIELIAERSGTREQVAAVTERAMRGELDFEQSLHARVATLKGISDDVFDAVRQEVTVTAGAEELVRAVQSNGGDVALVSGGFAEIVVPLAAGFDIDKVRANRLEVDGGVLTGRVLGEVVDRSVKARMLQEYANELGVPLSRTVAVGDGANDLDMLGVAGLGIAFQAKPAVREQADMSLGFRRLDAIVALLGL